MSKKRGKRRHRQPPLPPRGPSLEEILAEAQALQEEGHPEEALAVLEEAPPHLQRRLELLLPRAGLYMLMGETVKAAALLDEAQRLAPDDPLLAFFLGSLHYGQGRIIHARQAIQRAIRHSLPDEAMADARTVLEESEGAIRRAAEEFGLSFEEAEELLRCVEEAGQEIERDRLREAARLLHRAAQMAPSWPGLRANEALLRFFDGEVDEAIRICEEILDKGDEDLHALANLVRCHLARGEREKAEAYARRLRLLRPEHPADIGRLVEALGFLEDDEALYELYQRCRLMVEELDGLTLMILGSAAANTGHPRVARRLWRLAGEAGVFDEAFQPLWNALDRKAPGPGRARRYPTVLLPSLIPPGRLVALFELADDWYEDRIDEQTLERRMEEFVRRNPHAVQAVAKMVWEEEDPTIGIDLLGLIDTQDAIAELERFAFSQAGAKSDRLYALETLVEMGVVDASQPVRIWDEERQVWEEVQPILWEITTDVELPSYSEEVWDLIDEGTEALNEGDLQRAREKLEAAIALEPQAAIAHHNLAVVLQRQGDWERAREHLKEALEVNPHYVHARCTLAWHYLKKEEPEAAFDILEPVARQSTLTPEEWRYYQLTMAEVAIAREEYDAAHAYVQALLEMNPDDEAAQRLLWRVRAVEMMSVPSWLEQQRRAWLEQQERDRRREEQKRRRPTRPDAGLVECLERLTKNALIGTARAMPIPRKYNVRKATLIQDLVQYLTIPLELRKVVQTLREEERQALRDVLETGGTMDWERFAARYGDDLDESPRWQWSEPETVMGRLRMLGLLSEGTVDKRLIVLIPRELRELLPPLLEE